MTEQADTYQSKIGTEFIITLTNKSKEAVFAAVTTLQNDPRVSYVTLNYLVTPDTP